MATTLKTVTVNKCRKEHPCIWCGETIAISEPCHSHIYVEHHEFCEDRFHLECSEAVQRMQNEEKSWGEPFEPYVCARGSTLLKEDFRKMCERNTTITA